MLAIKKRYKSFRALSAGSIAFAIGLSGAAVYVGNNLVHQNLTFRKEQPITSPADKASANNKGSVTIDRTDHGGAVLYEQPRSTSAEPLVTTAPPVRVVMPSMDTTEGDPTSSTTTTSDTQSTSTTEPILDSSATLPPCSLIPSPVPGQNCHH